MKTSKKVQAPVIFEQRNRLGEVRGRLIEENGVTRAESLDDGVWERATPSQAERIFVQALSIARLRAGTEVIAWDGARLLRGHYVGSSTGRYEVRLGQSTVYVDWVLPFAVASHFGVWVLREDMQVLARIDGEWRHARYDRFEEGQHYVYTFSGRAVTAERVLIAADAVQLGLIND